MPTTDNLLANLASALQAVDQHVERLTPATPIAVLNVLQQEINETLRELERMGSERRRAPSVMAAGEPLGNKVAVPREEKVAVPEVAMPRQGAVAKVDRIEASPTRPQPGQADAQPMASKHKRSAPDDDSSHRRRKREPPPGPNRISIKCE
jgi:hypothetical protein